MNLYSVTLEWPRSAKQAAYQEEVKAMTQTEAKIKAAGSAYAQGWKGSPSSMKAVILKNNA